MYSVPLQNLIDEYNLTTYTRGMDMREHRLEYPRVHRPALQLAGFYDYFNTDAVHVIGRVEYAFLKTLDTNARAETFKKLFAYKLPVIVMCREIVPFPEMLEQAYLTNTPVLGYSGSTSEFLWEAGRWLNVQLAPRVTMHGVLVDVYGEGLLITGKSGIGKSETALELIKRGHRLVADDAVEIKKVSSQTLVGSSPEVIRHLIELRGIGVMDISQMFGVQAIMLTQQVDLCVQLEVWNEQKEYDRLGVQVNYINILDNMVVCHTIPVRPGRNLAVICEAAAVNHRQKKMGYNAASVLQERVSKNIKNTEGE